MDAIANPSTRESRAQITGLREALIEAGNIIGSEGTLRRCLDLVLPGVYLQYNLSISVDNDGNYKVSLQSATHGTTVLIGVMKELKKN